MLRLITIHVPALGPVSVHDVPVSEAKVAPPVSVVVRLAVAAPGFTTRTYTWEPSVVRCTDAASPAPLPPSVELRVASAHVEVIMACT